MYLVECKTGFPFDLLCGVFHPPEPGDTCRIAWEKRSFSNFISRQWCGRRLLVGGSDCGVSIVRLCGLLIVFMWGFATPHPALGDFSPIKPRILTWFVCGGEGGGFGLVAVTNVD